MSRASDFLAGVWSRIGSATGASSAVDRQAASAAGSAMDELMRREPALAAQITGQVNAAVAQSLTAANAALVQGLTAATAASQTIVQNTLRQAAVALIQAQPYLEQQLNQIAARGGSSAADGAADTLQTRLIPLAIGALVVGVAVYGISRSTQRSR